MKEKQALKVAIRGISGIKRFDKPSYRLGSADSYLIALGNLDQVIKTAQQMRKALGKHSFRARFIHQKHDWDEAYAQWKRMK